MPFFPFRRPCSFLLCLHLATTAAAAAAPAAAAAAVAALAQVVPEVLMAVVAERSQA
jgi:hypothetical protein